MGIDGGYVRAAHKEGYFEVIAGKSVLAFCYYMQETRKKVSRAARIREHLQGIAARMEAELTPAGSKMCGGCNSICTPTANI